VARQEIAAPDGPETHLSRKRVPVAKSTILSSGPINGGDTLTVELIQPDRMPVAVRIVWPSAATITTPAHYLEVASAAMRLLAEASTTLANPSESTALANPWRAWRRGELRFPRLGPIPLARTGGRRNGSRHRATSHRQGRAVGECRASHVLSAVRP
jgi:hypothetical protein